MISPLYLCLTALDGLLLWAIAASRRGWWSVKLAAILVVVAVNLLALQGLYSAAGWPKSAPFVDGVLVYCAVQEPDPAAHIPGAIYIWEVPGHVDVSSVGFSFRPKNYEPRAYREPYTRALHMECYAAQQAIKQGLAVGIKGMKSKRAHSKGAGGPGARYGQHGAQHFYLLPPPSLTQKNH